jgi:prolyl oligopeptidase
VLRTSPDFFKGDGLEVTKGMAVSADGTRIPWTRVARADAEGPQPTLLYGYGGFEISLQPTYDAVLGASWLERGGAYVVTHIRGGGEFGPRWHRAALKHKRQRAFDDFIAVGEYLIAEGLAQPDGLGIQGGSNGGALVGAVFTQRPDLWTAVVCEVPLLDFLRYHLLSPGASWIGEYGDPEDPADRAVLSAWSPLQQLRAGVDYPPILLTTSTRDDRVHPNSGPRSTTTRRSEVVTVVPLTARPGLIWRPWSSLGWAGNSDLVSFDEIWVCRSRGIGLVGQFLDQ